MLPALISSLSKDLNGGVIQDGFQKSNDSITLEHVLKLENLVIIWDYFGSKPPPVTKSVT
jgi:hypothetical protein